MENQIDVQLTERDIEIIKSYVSQIEAPNCYLEIGVHEGGSALQALEVAKPEAELYGVDPLDNFKLKDTRFNFINKFSLEAVKEWDKSIQVLFIDGDHDSAGKDFEAWDKFVVSGGIVLFHDYAKHSPLVIRDCNNIRNDNRYETMRVPGETDKSASSIFIVKKL